MKTIVRFIAIISVLLFAAGSVYAGKKDPVAVLFQVKGKIEYTKNGKKWRKVRRNKFLFAGYQVRSMENSSGKITVKTTGKNLTLDPNTVLEITTNDVKVLKGNVGQAEKTNRLVSGLVKKFSKSQSYTTVRRAANTGELKLNAVRDVVISNNYPFMVWDNLDNSYSYKLMIGDKVYEIAASDSEYVRAKIDSFAGKKEFKIIAIQNGAEIAELQPYKSRGELKNHTVSWLSSDQQQELDKIVTELAQEYGEDTFILGTYYEKQDMWVAAMDQYRKYLADNPDDIEMTPYLFRVYKKLKLDGIYKKELEAWNLAMAE